jgi:hypothetical protein
MGARRRRESRAAPQPGRGSARHATHQPAVPADTRWNVGRPRAGGAAEIVVEVVTAPDAPAVLAVWGERLAALGRERLAGRGAVPLAATEAGSSADGQPGDRGPGASA